MFSVPDAQDKPAVMLNRAMEAYKGFRYEEALFWTDRILAHASATRKQRLEAMVWAGAAAYLMGDLEKARQYFRKLHAYESQTLMRPEWFPKHMVRFFHEAILHDL